MDYTIRPIRANHTRQLKGLFDQALATDFDYFPSSYLDQVRQQNTAAKLLVAILRPSRYILGGYYQQKLCGYVVASREDPNTGFIFWLYVADAHRGHGLGRKILSEVESKMKLNGIKTIRLVTHNQADFYAMNNYQTIATLESVAESIPMNLMVKDLAP